jgi:hypothetical protein
MRPEPYRIPEDVQRSRIGVGKVTCGAAQAPAARRGSAIWPMPKSPFASTRASQWLVSPSKKFPFSVKSNKQTWIVIPVPGEFRICRHFHPRDQDELSQSLRFSDLQTRQPNSNWAIQRGNVFVRRAEPLISPIRLPDVPHCRDSCRSRV